MGYLYENPSTVAAFGIGTFGTAVFQVFQYGQSVVDDIVGPVAFDVDDETDATGIVFISRVIEPLWCW